MVYNEFQKKYQIYSAVWFTLVFSSRLAAFDVGVSVRAILLTWYYKYIECCHDDDDDENKNCK